MKTKKLLAVIPARGGSKRIPNKSIVRLGGMPLIHYVINAAKKAKSIDCLVVSTDSKKIASVARKCGADAPFIRPKALARDDTPTLPVLRHALEFFEKEEGILFDAVACLQLTSPFILAKDIDKAWKIFVQGARSVVSVSPVDAHPEWLFSLTKTGKMKPLVRDGKMRKKRSQDLSDYYTLNGAIGIQRAADVLSGRIVYDHACVIPAGRGIDIDTPEDLESARRTMRAMNLRR